MTRVDHVLVSVADLDGAMKRWADAGLDTMRGGQHPGGTSNALLRGPESAYVELISANADGDATSDRVRRSPGPLGWALGVTDIDAVHAALADSGYTPAPVRLGSRTTTDGDILSWRLADIVDSPIDPIFPFIIQWDRVMPAGPEDGPRLREVVVDAPEPDKLSAVLQVCGLREAGRVGSLTDGTVTVTLNQGVGGIREITLVTGGRDRDLVLDGLQIRCRA